MCAYFNKKRWVERGSHGIFEFTHDTEISIYLIRRKTSGYRLEAETEVRIEDTRESRKMARHFSL